MEAEAYGLKIGSRGLRLLACGCDCAAYPAPQIDLVVEVERKDELAGGRYSPEAYRKVRSIRRVADAHDAWRHGDGRKFRRAVVLDRGPRLAEARLGGFQILVGDGNLLFQRVQRSISEDLPPGAARKIGQRFCGFPLPGFFERVRRRLFIRRRRRGGGPLIFRANHATRKQDHPDKRDPRARRSHGPALSGCLLIRTRSLIKESRALMITTSFAVSPKITSTVAP